MAYEALIRDKLDYILLSLRYGNDPAWEGVYRPQCIRASSDPNAERAAMAAAAAATDGKNNSPSFFPLFAWYQARSERTLALHNLLPSAHASGTSAHGGLALELFRYSDYRQPDRAVDGPESREGDEETEEEKDAVAHQHHHPFSSLFPSHGGAGGGDTGRVNVHRAIELADVYYASL